MRRTAGYPSCRYCADASPGPARPRRRARPPWAHARSIWPASLARAGSCATQQRRRHRRSRRGADYRPGPPTIEDSAAAANLAARLGFETTSLTLPLVQGERRRTGRGRRSADHRRPRIGGVRTLNDRGDIDLAASAGPGAHRRRAVAAWRRRRPWSSSGRRQGHAGRGQRGRGALAAAVEHERHHADRPRRSGGALPVVARHRRPSRGQVDRRRQRSPRSGERSTCARPWRPRRRRARSRRSRSSIGCIVAGWSRRRSTSRRLRRRASSCGPTDGRRRRRRAARRSQRPHADAADRSQRARHRLAGRSRPAGRCAPRRAAGKTFDLSNPVHDRRMVRRQLRRPHSRSHRDEPRHRQRGRRRSAPRTSRRGSGLETTGVTLPLARTADEVRDPAREQNPILVGRDNRLVQDLVKIGRADLSTCARRRRDPDCAEGVRQSDRDDRRRRRCRRHRRRERVSGAARAVRVGQPARRVVVRRRQDRDVARSSARGAAAGQASQALGEIDDLLARDRDARERHGRCAVVRRRRCFSKTADAGLDTFLDSALSTARSRSAKVTVKSEAMTAPTPVIDETLDIPWEVDEFWTRFRSEVLPKVSRWRERRYRSAAQRVARIPADDRRPGTRRADQGRRREPERPDSVRLQAGLSVADRARHPRAQGQGRTGGAHQGCGVQARPVEEVQVLPGAEPLAARTVSGGRHHPARAGHRQGTVQPGARRLAQGHLHGRGARRERPRDPHGDASARSSSSASTWTSFPGWSRVDVTTGWLTAQRQRHRRSLDARIQTDPERFWDQYQAKILPRIYDHVMKVTDNRPLPDKQPFHRDLDVEVLDERAGLPHRRGRGAGLVARVAARGSLLRHARFLRRARAHDDAAAAGRARQDLPDHPSRAARASRDRCACCMPATRRREPQLEVALHGEGRRRSPRRCAASSRKIDTSGAAGPACRRPRAMRSARSSCRSSRRTIAKRPAPPMRSTALARLHAAGLFKTALSLRPRRSRRRRDRAARRADAARASRTPAPRRRRTCARRRAKPTPPGRHVGPRHRPRRVRDDRRRSWPRIPRSRPTRPACRIAAATSR